MKYTLEDEFLYNGVWIRIFSEKGWYSHKVLTDESTWVTLADVSLKSEFNRAVTAIKLHLDRELLMKGIV